MSMINHSTPRAVLAQLNQFEVDHPIVGDPGDQPVNIWEDLIFDLDGYNEFATMAADPKEYSNVVVVNFDRGPVTFRYQDRRAEWVIA